MKLSDHFTLAEFTRSDSARRLGIDNTPPRNVLENLEFVASNLEKVRRYLSSIAHVDVPIVVTSGYRSPELNSKLSGSSNTSDHVKGLAVDFVAPVFGNPYSVAVELKTMPGLTYDQLILEPTWVHLGFGSRMRKQVFTLNGKQSANGIVRL